MFVVETSALIPQPVPAVFAAAAGLESAVRWQSGVCGVRRPRGRSARTGPLVLLYRALGEQYLLGASVTAFDAPARFGYVAAGDDFAFEATLALEATPEGTRVRYHVALDTRPAAARALGDDTAVDAPRFPQAAELRRLVARRVAGDMDRLAAWVRAREDGTARTYPSPPAPAAIAG